MTADLSQQAEALLALSERATPGPWLPDESGYGSCYGRSYKNVDCPDAGAGVAACWAYSFSLYRSLPAEANAAFIAAARTTAPALAAAYLAMRWRPITEAPRDHTPVIVCKRDAGGDITGEAYFYVNEDHREGGEWYWANVSPGDYTGEPITPPPTYFIPLSALPTLPPGGDHEAQG